MNLALGFMCACPRSLWPDTARGWGTAGSSDRHREEVAGHLRETSHFSKGLWLEIVYEEGSLLFHHFLSGEIKFFHFILEEADKRRRV